MPSTLSTLEVVESLQNQVSTKNYLDVGKGAEKILGVSQVKLKKALELLEEFDYSVHRLKFTNLAGSICVMKVLTQRDVSWAEAYSAAKNNLVVELH
jgi:hypothetical protein